MSKQEEVREHLVELFKQTDFSKETPEQLADAVLWVENEDGVVIRVEKNINEFETLNHIMVMTTEGELKYVAVESLIKEGE